MALLELIAAGVAAVETSKKIYEEIEELGERTYVVEIINGTSKSMQLVREDMETGKLGSPSPPEHIGPFDGGFFAAHNDFATGVDGSVSYRVEGVGDFLAGFTNPIAGDNWVNVNVGNGFDQQLSVIGTHSAGNHATARFVVTDRNPPMPQVQQGWRSCPKCQGLHYAGIQGFKGACPAGGEHEQFGSFSYVTIFDSLPAEYVQPDWRSCRKCQGLHYAGFQGYAGVCPAGGGHDPTASFAYVSLFDVPVGQNRQADWRACRKCQGMFYGPFHGVCPAGGQHDGTGSFGYVQRFV
jgi:hypothetical protein